VKQELRFPSADSAAALRGAVPPSLLRAEINPFCKTGTCRHFPIDPFRRHRYNQPDGRTDAPRLHPGCREAVVRWLVCQQLLSLSTKPKCVYAIFSKCGLINGRAVHMKPKVLCILYVCASSCGAMDLDSVRDIAASCKLGSRPKGVFVSTNINSSEFYLMPKDLNLSSMAGMKLNTNAISDLRMSLTWQSAPSFRRSADGKWLSVSYIMISGRYGVLTGHTLTLTDFIMNVSWNEEPRDEVLSVASKIFVFSSHARIRSAGREAAGGKPSTGMNMFDDIIRPRGQDGIVQWGQQCILTICQLELIRSRRSCTRSSQFDRGFTINVLQNLLA
jgi:hypothetical protein